MDAVIWISYPCRLQIQSINMLLDAHVILPLRYIVASGECEKYSTAGIIYYNNIYRHMHGDMHYVLKYIVYF